MPQVDRAPAIAELDLLFRKPAVPQHFDVMNLAVALGIGLLIGVERERRKGDGPNRAAAGLRTYTAASQLGAIAVLTGGELMLAVVTFGVIALTAVAYWRSASDDPGLTSEIALVLVVLLGGLAMWRPVVAAGSAVILAVLLVARTPLHLFATKALTQTEINHGLILAAATAVALPILPDRPLDPFGALNPRAIWTIVVLVMAISACGYLAVRVFGSRWGLPLAGLASGFVSSTATIGAMATRAAASKEVLSGAVSGAVLSTVATTTQLALVLAVTNWPTFMAMRVPLLSAIVAAIGYAVIGLLRAERQSSDFDCRVGEPFSVLGALLFGVLLSAILLAAAILHWWLGHGGILIAAVIGGLADTHSAAASIATLVGSGRLQASDAVMPVLAALAANTVSKITVTLANGDHAFRVRVIPGLLLVVISAVAAAALSGLPSFK